MENQNPAAGRSTAMQSITRQAERAMAALFTYPRDRFGWIIAAMFLAGLLLFGLRRWGIFFNWGNLSFDFLDWAEVTGPRYAVLRDAITSGVLPLHVGNTTATRGVTDRFFSIADMPFSPQLLLLRFVWIGEYLFYDAVLFYLIGFVGLLLLARKFRLSPFAFAILFMLFNFNGNITAHYGVGHSIWTGYFLFPFFVLLVWSLVEKQAGGWRWALGFALVSLGVLMQGGLHKWVWMLLFLGVLGLFNLRLLKPVILGGLASVLLALPRLLPPALALEGITQEYLGGFPTVTELISSLIVLKDPDRATMIIKTSIYPLNHWEADYFIGLAGLAVLVIFGIVLPLRRDRSKDSPVVQVLVPCLALTILSVGSIYGTLVELVPIPPFTGERVTARIFLLPLVFLIVLAAVGLQRALDRAHETGRLAFFWQRVLLLALPLVIWFDLDRHTQAWSIRYLDGLVYLFPKVPFVEEAHTVANHADAVYTNLMLGGLAVAVPALIVMIVMAVREARRAPHSSRGGAAVKGRI